MPHAEVKYSADIEFDVTAALQKIEAIIHKRDDKAGLCKGRGTRVDDYHHSHIFVDIAMIDKPHRDAAFMQGLLAELEVMVKSHLSQPCEFSMALRFVSEHYLTGRFEP